MINTNQSSSRNKKWVFMFNFGKTEEEIGRLKALEELCYISFRPDGTILNVK